MTIQHFDDHIEHATFREGWVEFMKELPWVAEYPPGNDRVIKALGRATFDLVVEDEMVREGMRQLLSYAWERRIMGPSYTVNLWRSALQHELQDESGFPTQYIDNPTHWRKAICDRFDDAQSFAQLAQNMRRPLQSSMPTRYATVSLASHVFYRSAARVLDVGSSNTHGLVSLQTCDFSPIKVLRKPKHQGGMLRSLRAEQIVNHLLATPATTKVLASDAVNRDHAQRWIKSCSIRPEKLLDAEFMDAYNRHEALACGIDFWRGNLACSEDAVRLRRQLRGRKFHVVSYITVANQLTEEEHETLSATAREHLEDEGMELMADFVRPHPDDPTRLEFFSKWFNNLWLFRVLARFKSDEQRIWYELGAWDTSRCERLYLPTYSLLRAGLVQHPGYNPSRSKTSAL
ncbi:MAG TPA: hypothetical protein VJ836_04275 [Candidatus Saccharimonadales bacterium]|nr:hypothetical protein [Candidatus Saccharimonadales bacterium]